MGSWKIAYSEKALRDIADLDPSLRKQVFRRLEWFAEHFDELDPIPLHADWKGFYKFRVADLRIAYKYESTTRTIKVEYIDRRDKIYKKRR